MDNARDKQRKHYFFMAAVMMLTALIADLRFDMQNGYFWLIPCCFGFMGGVFIYAAIKSK
jgi:hypothetical protein